MDDLVIEPAELSSRLSEIRDRLATAAARSGRSPGDVTLVGVSKTHPAALVQAAWRAGLRVFGENRVQEALAKSRELSALQEGGPAPPGSDTPEWHLIGPLQSNKVRPALDLFRAIHSIDRPKIAEAIDREAAARGLRIDGFLEVNVGEEESKHGFPAGRLIEDAAPLAALSSLRIVGLMAIPPYEEDPEDARRWFARLRELRDRLAARPEWADFPGLLSMGMSHDYEIAVEEGATHVRVGTALFGERSVARG